MNTTGKFLRLCLSSPEFKEILKLDQTEFPRPWSEKEWASLNWDHHQLFAQKEGNQLCGFALLARIPGDDSSHLLKICLERAWRGSQISREFWTSIQIELKRAEVKSIYLEVESKNLRAIGFYHKCGFQTLRSIKGYYSDGEDALTMQLTL